MSRVNRIARFFGLAAALLTISGCADRAARPTGPLSAVDPLLKAKTQDNPESDADRLALAAGQALYSGNVQEASKLINHALQLRIDRSYYHLINGLAYHLQGKSGDRNAFDMAEQGYDQAIHFDQTNWLAFYFRGRLHIELGHYEKAMDDLAEALLFRPNDADILSSFGYAAYRCGRPDLMVGALQRLEATGRPVPAVIWRNLAMGMAALGRGDEADGYASRFKQEGAPAHDVEQLRQRLGDWRSVDRSAKVELAQYGGVTPSDSGNVYVFTPRQTSPAPSQPGTTPLSAEDTKTATGTEDKMVVIDVVLITTTETISSNRGVNLLTGLNLEFGGTVGATAYNAYSLVSTAGSTAITRAITIPSVNYTLNILNANNQRSEVLSRPTLVGLAGKQSLFFSGQELDAAAVSGGGSVLAGGVSIGGGQAINIQKEIGVRLGVTPTVLDDGRLKLAVNFERTFLETPSTNVNFTYKLETDKDQITANVVMRYGETLILGGLSEKETQYTRDGVPGLQDLPGMQYLFSSEAKSDYQKSTLILLTPRPPQYVYQPEKAREAYEKSLSEDERPIANLTARYADWFKPYPNWASIFHHLQENGLYREFRTGDVDLESWSSMQSLEDRLNQALDFLHY